MRLTPDSDPTPDLNGNCIPNSDLALSPTVPLIKLYLGHS